MRKTIPAAVVLVLLALGFAGCPEKPVVEPPKVEQKPLVVFLVRHAEKTTAKEDPDLSDEGKARAGELANTLSSADIEHVHSTDYKRTRDTAAPVAVETGLKVELYDPDKLADFAKELKDKGGRHLIVGHSNTTPELTKLLGGNPGSEIDEKSEYDRLYVITTGKDGTVNSALVRYGKPYQKTDKEIAPKP